MFYIYVMLCYVMLGEPLRQAPIVLQLPFNGFTCPLYFVLLGRRELTIYPRTNKNLYYPFSIKLVKTYFCSGRSRSAPPSNQSKSNTR